MNKNNMFVVGITGGAGSGKSLLTQWFSSWGALSLDVDTYANELMNNSSHIKRLLIKSFGDHALRENGLINRPYLAEIVFNDFNRLQELNTIVWPSLLKSIKEKLNILQKKYAGIYVLDMAVLFEAQADKLCDHTICVNAPEQERLKRLTEYRNLSVEQSLARISSQKRQAVPAICDTVIHNESSMDEFMKKARDLFTEISKNIN